MKILAVDDDDIALNLIQECLTQGGYESVTLISSPIEAISSLENTEHPYDCILLDVEMPKINGIELCADIRLLPLYRNTPILMITKRKDHASIKLAFANGATDYVTKPFEFFEVLTRIKVAERLVQERQAAIDSYMAVNAIDDRGASETDGGVGGYTIRGVDLLPNGLTKGNLIPLSNLQNYLERTTVNEGCAINLVAVKVCRIGDIFKETTATEFLNFLEVVAGSTIEVLGGNEAFIAHAGNGTFLYASQHIKNFDPKRIEQALIDRLSGNRLPIIGRFELEPEFSIGMPLLLTSTPKLNFKRAVKVATARMETRERYSIDTMLASISA